LFLVEYAGVLKPAHFAAINRVPSHCFLTVGEILVLTLSANKRPVLKNAYAYQPNTNPSRYPAYRTDLKTCGGVG
jgi:hypothetical protein